MNRLKFCKFQVWIYFYLLPLVGISQPDQTTSHPSIYLEFLGANIYGIGLGYEQLWTTQTSGFTLRGGMGLVGEKKISSNLGTSLLIGGNNRFEAGMNVIFNSEIENNSIVVTPLIGYRSQNIPNNTLIRFFIVPPLGELRGEIILVIGLVVGYIF